MPEFKTVRWRSGKIEFLDQTRLPGEERMISTDDVDVLAEAILSLRIRGAPAIGVAAAYGVLLAASKARGTFEQRSRAIDAITLLRTTRPTAVNLFYALERMERVLDEGPQPSSPLDRLAAEAKAIEQEDIDACRAISVHGASLIATRGCVLTHCNAGALATAGEGTALGIIIEAYRQGHVERVYVDETRPLLQGARLTMWELDKAGVPATLLTDNTAGFAIAQGKVQAIVVGADRIAANGDVANKVGTYTLAVLAARHGIPMIVAAPTSTVDPNTSSGAQIPIEERNASEVLAIGGVAIAPPLSSVYAPAFDVTPNELISAIVTERGVIRKPYADAIAALPLTSRK
jgi:methylthioribose-1-phosphate isomerase